MKLIYKCEYCGEIYEKRQQCINHENQHKIIITANKMIEDGCTLKEINDETHIWNKLPDYLKNVTKDNCFTIPGVQCCTKPAYRIESVGFNEKLYFYGCGNWDGFRKCQVFINDKILKNPRPKEELFIYSNN